MKCHKLKPCFFPFKNIFVWIWHHLPNLGPWIYLTRWKEQLKLPWIVIFLIRSIWNILARKITKGGTWQKHIMAGGEPWARIFLPLIPKLELNQESQLAGDSAVSRRQLLLQACRNMWWLLKRIKTHLWRRGPTKWGLLAIMCRGSTLLDTRLYKLKLGVWIDGSAVDYWRHCLETVEPALPGGGCTSPEEQVCMYSWQKSTLSPGWGFWVKGSPNKINSHGI